MLQVHLTCPGTAVNMGHHEIISASFLCPGTAVNTVHHRTIRWLFISLSSWWSVGFWGFVFALGFWGELDFLFVLIFMELEGFIYFVWGDILVTQLNGSQVCDKPSHNVKRLVTYLIGKAGPQNTTPPVIMLLHAEYLTERTAETPKAACQSSTFPSLLETRIPPWQCEPESSLLIKADCLKRPFCLLPSSHTGF